MPETCCFLGISCARVHCARSSPGSSDSMAAKSVPELKTLILDYARVAHCPAEQSDELERLVEACKAFLKQSGQAFLMEHAGQPILQQFCMDTTPTPYREYVASGPNPKIRGRTSAPAKAELLVQFTSFSCLNVDEAVDNQLVFRDPIPVQGKKTGQQLAAIAASCPAIFADAADSDVLRLKHIVLDRGVPVGIAHFLSGHWHGSTEQTPGPTTSSAGVSSSSIVEQTGAHSSLLHWHTYVGCVCHDLHNALKWSMSAEFQDTDMLKKIYNLCVASRHLYMAIYNGLGSALWELLVPSNASTLPSTTQLRNLWESLQLGEDLVEELVHFKIICLEGVLHVDEESMKDPDAMARLSACLMGAWAFKTFSASRWLTIGQSCRTLLAAWLSGYQLIAAALDSEDKLPAFEVAALNAIDQSCRRFVCVASFAALLPEALLAFVFRDNRVARNQHILLDMCWSGLHLIEGLDDFTLRVVGQIGGKTVPELQHSLIKSTLIQFAYLEHRVFEVVRSYPWYLCAGNVDKNLEEFFADDSTKAQHHDHVTQSLIALHDIGYGPLPLARAVKLLAEASWSSYLVEKMHASTSVVRKHRPELGLNHLLCRAFMHMFAQLLPTSSPLEKVLHQLQRRWWKVAGRQPQFVGGRQIFLAVLMQKMHITNEARRSRGQTVVLSSDVMASHGKLWRKLSDVQKKGYSELAARSRATIDRHSLEQETSLERQMQECLAEQKENQLNGSQTMTFSSVTVSETGLHRCLDLFQTLEGHSSLVQEKRRKEMQCPEPISDQDYEQWRAKSVCVDHANRPKGCKSDILKRVSLQRDDFTDAAFEIAHADGSRTWFRFVFSLQRPVLAYFLPLKPCYVNVQLDVDDLKGRDLRDFTAAVPTMKWVFEQTELSSDDPFAEEAIANISVYMTTILVPGSCVLTYDVAYPLEEMLAVPVEKVSNVGVERETSGKRADKAKQVRADILVENPWVSSFLASERAKSSASASMSTSSHTERSAVATHDCEAASETDELLDEIFVRAFDALDASRQADDTETVAEGFVFSLLAGAWQVKRTGRQVYGHRCDCRRDSLARTFAAHFDLPVSASFEQTKFGERGSVLMVQLWARRMEALANFWDRQGRGGDVFSRDIEVPFQAADIIEELTTCLPAAGRKRFREICALRPKVSRV